MSSPANMNPQLLQNLQDYASQRGLSIEDLLQHWLDSAQYPAMLSRYQQMFTNNHAVQLLIDPADGRIVEANPAALEFYGYSLEDFQQMYIQDINVLTREEVQAEMKRAQERERHFFEFRHRLANGEIRSVDVFSGPVETREGHFLYSIIVDATERHRLNEAGRRSEEQLRMALEGTRAAVWEWDDESGRSVLNESGAQIIGQALPVLSDLRLDAWLEMVHPADVHRLRSRIETHLKGESDHYEAEYRIRHRDGHWVWLLDRGEIMHRDPDGRPLRMFGTFSDISQRKAIEAELRESELRYRTVADFSTDWTYWLKADGSLHYVSPVCEVISGYIPQELYANPWLLDDMVYREDYPLWEAHRHQPTSESSIQRIQLRIVRKDGRLCWIEHVCRPIFTADGEFDGYRVSNHDITEQKHMQEREFDLALEKERLRLLSEFIQNAAHEFRTPLSTINTQAYLISRKVETEKLKTSTAQIQEQVQRMTRLVDLLLMMNKLEMSTIIGWQLITLVPLLTQIHQALVSEHGETPVLYLSIAEDLPQVWGEPEYLIFALCEILNNAYRFTPAEGQIHLRAMVRTEQTILIEVRDNGRGIEGPQQSRVFDTFWRDDEAHTTPGLGLGLTIARKIIQIHGGDIELESEISVGSVFRVLLPAAVRAEGMD